MSSLRTLYEGDTMSVTVDVKGTKVRVEFTVTELNRRSVLVETEAHFQIEAWQEVDLI